MATRWHSYLGPALVLVFCLSQAFRDVYFGHAFQGVDFFAIILLAFLASTILFTTVPLIRDRGAFKKLRGHGRTVLMMNLTTALAWSCYFFGLSHLEPSIVNTVPFTVIFTFCMVISPLHTFLDRRAPSRAQLLSTAFPARIGRVPVPAGRPPPTRGGRWRSGRPTHDDLGVRFRGPGVVRRCRGLQDQSTGSSRCSPQPASARMQTMAIRMDATISAPPVVLRSG